MFKKEKDDLKEKLFKKIDENAKRAQLEYDQEKKRALKLIDPVYVRQKMAELTALQDEFEEKQKVLLEKNAKKIKYTELDAFPCFTCGAPVDMKFLTCSRCGALYCQWCGAAMDMLDPSRCPRCNNPPFYTPAELIITTVESIAPEDRFWEQLPLCPKCGASIQEDWTECPICLMRLTPTKIPSWGGDQQGESGEMQTDEFSGVVPQEEHTVMTDENLTISDDNLSLPKDNKPKVRMKKEKSKKTGI